MSDETMIPGSVLMDKNGNRIEVVDKKAREDIAELSERVDGLSQPGSAVEVDATLSQEGKAADAKATGDALASLSEDIARFGIVEPMHDDIPRIFFGASIPQSKTETVMEFRYASNTLDFDGYCETKAQGNSSMSYPKKNQTTKLFDDLACDVKHKIDFKNWGKQNKFCLKANWIDLTHARNIVSARLWGDVVKSRAGFDSLPELMKTSPNYGAVDGFPVRVFSAGKYQGRYTLNIPKDKWMANMDDENPNHCILCGENYASGCFRAEAKIDGSDWSDEVHDEVPENILTRWNQVISFVMNSTDEEFVANLDSYIDVESAIDYYLFGLAVCNLDGFGKNQLYLTYDGLRWYASAYDMDSTFGLHYDARGFNSAKYPRTSYEDYVSSAASGEGNLLYIRLAALFEDRILTRWEELRHSALSASNIINRFEEFTEITPPYIVEEDYAATTAGGAFVNIPLQDSNNIQQIRAYAFDRLAYVHGYLTGETAETNLWSMSGKTEKPLTDMSYAPGDIISIEDGTYSIGVSRNGHWKAAWSAAKPEATINGDDITVLAKEAGAFGYGVFVPVPLESGESYEVSADIDGYGCASLMYYDEDGKYMSTTTINPIPCVGGQYKTTITIPQCGYVAANLSCNGDPAGTVPDTATFSNIKIVKL